MKALTFMGASTLAGALTGGLFGLAGEMLPFDARAMIGAVASTVGFGLGLLEVSGKKIRLVQVDRETPQSWIHAGPVAWAALNGVALGFGAFTRLGFSLWYTVPLGALLSGDRTAGLLIYGAYGFVRGASALLTILYAKRTGRDFGCLLRYRGLARVASGGFLVFLGAAAAVVTGL